MLVFLDALSGSELFSDAVKVKDMGTHYIFTAEYTKRSGGDIDDSLIGGNASAEQESEKMECDVKHGLDFVLDNRLCDRSMDKKGFKLYIKPHLMKLKKEKCGEDSEQAKEFEKRAHEFFMKEIFPQIDELNMFFGEQDDELCGTCCFSRMHDDGKAADVWVFKDGVKEVKY